MPKGLREPHIFNASSNPLKLIKNLEGLFSSDELLRIYAEIDHNVVLLYRLGESHRLFSVSVAGDWRQSISRLYYGAYNIRRAVALKVDGTFSMEVSDHQKVNQIPDSFANFETHRALLNNLRDDRNLADYSHLAVENDLFMTVDEYQLKISDFVDEAKSFLAAKGIMV